jgi:Spy/CpxP family protein refolding chaperone
MSKTIQKSALLLIAALFIASSGTAYAQCPKNEAKDTMPMHGEKMQGHMMIPDLTDSQKDKMQTLHFEHMKAVQPLQNEMMEKQARLHTLQTADKVNMAEINKVIEDIGQIRTEIMKLRAAQHQKIRSLLTDEQRVFFDAHKPQHKGPREHHLPKHNDSR